MGTDRQGVDESSSSVSSPTINSTGDSSSVVSLSLCYAMNMNQFYSPSVSVPAVDTIAEVSPRGARDLTLDSEEESAPGGLVGLDASPNSPTMNIAMESSSSDSLHGDVEGTKVPPALGAESWRSGNSGTLSRMGMLVRIEEPRLGNGTGEERPISVAPFARSGDASPTMSFREGGKPMGVGERIRTCLMHTIMH